MRTAIKDIPFNVENIIRDLLGMESEYYSLDEIFNDESGTYWGRDNWVSTARIARAIVESYEQA